MAVKIFLLTCVVFPSIHCVTLVPERANVTEYSEKYVHYARTYVTRYSRKSPYYMNMEAHLKHSWTNNVTVNIVLYEYLANEYRRSFIEIHAGVCEILEKNPFYFGSMFKNKGIACPIKANEYHLLNMTLPLEDFKYVMPFHKLRADIVFRHRDTQDTIIKGYINASVKTK